MGELNNGNAGQPTPVSTASTPSTGSSIDIEQLAEKVYQLMRDDARLDRARGKLPGRCVRDIRR